MTPWTQRPADVGNLLNPAFCGILIRKAVAGYQSISNSGMPFALAFLVLPVLLHKNTRGTLPIRISTLLQPWLQNNPEVRLGFAERVQSVNPYTREAISFLLASNALSITSEGELVADGRIRASTDNMGLTPEVEDCLRQANFLGRWFATSGSARNIFTFWGIRP